MFGILDNLFIQAARVLQVWNKINSSKKTVASTKNK